MYLLKNMFPSITNYKGRSKNFTTKYFLYSNKHLNFRFFVENSSLKMNLTEDDNKMKTIHSKVTTTFKNEIIKELIKSTNKHPKNKINEEVLEIMNELIKALVIETGLRSAKQASMKKKSIVSLEHVEICVPQIMLDFP